MNNNEAPTVGIYLGSRMGTNPSFKNAIISLGKGVAKYGYTVVYGGGGTGLMGLLAETVKSHGGTVIGITTEHLAEIEKPSTFLDELHVVPSMYERKRLIHEKSSHLLAMPGGLGTFDELFETWCAIKIGVIKKSLGLVNIEGYFNPMLQFVTACTDYGLVNVQDVSIPIVYDEVTAYLNYLEDEKRSKLFGLYSNLDLAPMQNKHNLIEVEETS